MVNSYMVLFFTLAFALITGPCISSRTAEEEATIADVVDRGAESGSQDNNGAYNPDMYSGNFERDVQGASMPAGASSGGGASRPRNATRRNLNQCVASNPIDKCWRCKPDWADNRKALADCALGFGKGTTGGAAGEIYTVTDPSDDDATKPKEGTLRFAASIEKPTWIIFEKDMVINLKHALHMTSDTTIDGRGARVEITNGGGLSIHTIKNVIIHGIIINDVREMEGYAHKAACDGDGIAVKTSTKVWIDHCTLTKGPDGLIDVGVGATDVTLSNNKFDEHDKIMLLGADDSHTEDKAMKITVAYNKFESGCTQRMPRCRHGFFHVVNNFYNKWKLYAIGGSANPTILCQGNKFVAPDDPNTKTVTQRAYASEEEWKKWNWKSDKDSLENGAIFVESGNLVPTPDQEAGLIPAEPADSVPQLTNAAGALTCVKGQGC